MAAVVKRAETIASPDKADFFNHMYAELSKELQRQRDSKATHSLGQESTRREVRQEVET